MIRTDYGKVINRIRRPLKLNSVQATELEMENQSAPQTSSYDALIKIPKELEEEFDILNGEIDILKDLLTSMVKQNEQKQKTLLLNPGTKLERTTQTLPAQNHRFST